MVYFLGFRPYDFKDEETNRQIKGISLHFADNETQGATGFIPYKASVNDEQFNSLFGNDVNNFLMQPVQVSFNQKGKPTSIVIVQRPASK